LCWVVVNKNIFDYAEINPEFVGFKQRVGKIVKEDDNNYTIQFYGLYYQKIGPPILLPKKIVSPITEKEFDLRIWFDLVGFE
jgi:hypothetical protein